MKLLLAIDVADDVAEAYEDLTVDYDLRGTPKEDRTVNESIKYIEDAEPRPLPEKDEEPEDDLNTQFTDKDAYFGELALRVIRDVSCPMLITTGEKDAVKKALIKALDEWTERKKNESSTCD